MQTIFQSHKKFPQSLHFDLLPVAPPNWSRALCLASRRDITSYLSVGREVVAMGTMQYRADQGGRNLETILKPVTLRKKN